MTVQKTEKLHSLKFFRRSEASAYLKEKWGWDYAHRTLAKIACISSDGPEMHYIGRIPYYSQQALDEFAQKKIGPACRSTSDRDGQPLEVATDLKRYDLSTHRKSPRPLEENRQQTSRKVRAR
jgi:hypothetical protein